jgi:hypothetical protein
VLSIEQKRDELTSKYVRQDKLSSGENWLPKTKKKQTGSVKNSEQ